MRFATTLSCLLIAAALLSLPAGAAGAVAGRGTLTGEDLFYGADPGEANRLTVSRDGDRIVFSDLGARITPGAGCTAVTPKRVSCERSQFVSVRLADDDDQATTSGDIGNEIPIYFDGEQGNDTLRGTADRNSLTGGPGTDVLEGGPGTESISAAEEVGGGSSLEMPELAPKRDQVTCVAQPSAPPPASSRTVSVDESDAVSGPCGQVAVFTEKAVVSRGTEGADLLSGYFYPTRLEGRGGNDQLFATGTEANRLDGGAGNDVIEGGGLLLGREGNDRLSSAVANEIPVRQDGGPGDDVLLGRYGNDRLTGGTGLDRISANSGKDLIRARDGERDSVRCGDGRDRVSADRIDKVARDCERVTRAAAAGAASVRATPASRGCRAASRSRGAKIVKKSRSAVMFTKGFYTYGCLFKRGKVRRLLDEGGGIKTDRGPDGPRLEGRYVAYVTFGSAIGDEFDRVVVFDLRRGRVKFEAGAVFAQSLVLKKNGSVAWIQTSEIESADSDRPFYEVREFSAVDLQDDLLLDRSSDIDTTSLEKSEDGASISWQRGAETRSAPLR